LDPCPERKAGLTPISSFGLEIGESPNVEVKGGVSLIAARDIAPDQQVLSISPALRNRFVVITFGQLELTPFYQKNLHRHYQRRKYDSNLC
jgi:hypothetical protein